MANCALNACDIYGVKVVYKTYFFYEDSESVVVSGWLNLAYFIDEYG